MFKYQFVQTAIGKGPLTSRSTIEKIKHTLQMLIHSTKRLRPAGITGGKKKFMPKKTIVSERSE